MTSLLEQLLNGDQLSDARILALGLPSVPSAIRGNQSAGANAGTGYVDAKYGFGFVDLTFNSLVLAVRDDGSTGSASVKLLDVPTGVFKARGVVPGVIGNVTTSWNPTSPLMSIGSAAAGADATLTGTEADVVASTALTISSNAFSFAPDNVGGLVALTDSTGGTASATLAAITAGASYAQADLTAVKNAIASLAASVESLRLNTAGAYCLNATAVPQAIYLNFACNSDPTTAKTITLSGVLRVAFDVIGDN